MDRVEREEEGEEEEVKEEEREEEEGRKEVMGEIGVDEDGNEEERKPAMQVPLPEHTTPASSMCLQLWSAHPLKGHDARRLSFPIQWTSSIQIVPVPAGYSLK